VLLDLRELDLPMYNPDDDEPGEAAARVTSTRWSSPPGRSAAGLSRTSSPSRRPPSRLLGSAGFLLGRPLGRRESLETLVRNRLAAFDREAVGPCGKPGFGALEGGELVA